MLCDGEKRHEVKGQQTHPHEKIPFLNNLSTLIARIAFRAI